MRTGAYIRVLILAIIAALTTVSGLSRGAVSAAEPALGLHLSSCVMGSSKVPARCGTFVTYEDRTARKGRRLSLRLVVLNAKTPTNRAIFWNPGGPGASAVDPAGAIADGVFEKELAQLRDEFNIVFVDNRGTGGSHQIQCDLSPPAHPEYYFASLWPDRLLRSCRDAFARTTNLNLYSTSIAADDLDDIRAALHFPKIVLDGGSYGTMFFLDYARRHPARVESLVLQGVAPPHYLLIPLEDAQGAQVAMNHLIADCEQDALCRSRYPNLGAHFAALVSRIDKGPIRVSVVNASTKQNQTVLLSKEVFADRLRQTLYSTYVAAYVPFIIERAYAQDYAPLGQMVQTTTQGFAQLVADGLNLSVTCAEDLPFISESKIRSTSANTFEGDVRVRAQQQACRIWNVRPVSAAFVQPVRSNAPILMISGTDDPTTPAQYARQALRYLPNGRQVLIPHASHDTEVPCADQLIVTFVRSPSTNLKVASCAGTYHRPPFKTSMADFGD